MAGPHGGTVAFDNGTTAIAGCGAKPVNTTSGAATCQTSSLPVGSDQITAVYSGDTSYQGSSSPPLTETIVPDTPHNLANLTLQYVKGSAKFQALAPPVQKVIEALANQAIAALGKITPQLTPAELAINALEPIQKAAYLRLNAFPVEDPDWEVGIEEMLALPYYQSIDGMGVGTQAIDPDPYALSYDRVPKDEVEIRRASAVTSSNGDHLGHVDGFVVDDGYIAHLVLEQGHLWAKREIAIPIAAVARTQSDEVVLSWSTDEVAALKPLPVHRWQS